MSCLRAPTPYSEDVTSSFKIIQSPSSGRKGWARWASDVASLCNRLVAGETKTFCLACVLDAFVTLFVARIVKGALLRRVKALAPCNPWGGVFSCSDIFLYTS